MVLLKKTKYTNIAKAYGFVLVFSLIISCGKHQHQNGKKDAASEWKFIFKDRKKRFLNIRSGVINASFNYYNNTGDPQLIDSVKTSCGCTNVQYSKKPINPNDSGTLRVTIDLTNEYGSFNNTVGVYFHNQKPVVLKVIGTIADISD